MKIAVTGANGYIGNHVVNAILDRGYPVTAIDFNNSNISERAEFLQYDILNAGIDVYEKLGRPDVFVHLAWKDNFDHNSTANMQMLSDHYILVENLLNGGLKHLAVMGTMHEIGYHEGAIDENTPCNPTSLYGIAKDSLRRASFLLAKKQNAVLQWMRGYYIYGDDAISKSIFGKIMRAAAEGKTTFPFTQGKNKYDFIHVAELGRQIAALVTQSDVAGVVNCCSGKPVSLAEQVEAFIKSNNLNIKLEYGAFPERPYDSPAVWGDNAKMMKVLQS